MPTIKDRTAYQKQRRERQKLEIANSNHVGPVKKRICAEEGCTTTLNTYNLNDCCWAHNTDYVIRNGIKVGIN